MDGGLGSAMYVCMRYILYIYIYIYSKTETPHREKGGIVDVGVPRLWGAVSKAGVF